MKLIFEENDDLKQVVQIHQIFGPPNGLTTVMREHPILFGQSFLEVSKINRDAMGLQHGYHSLYTYLLGGKMSSAETKRCKSIIARFKSIPRYQDADWPKTRKEFKVKIARLYREKENEISKDIREIFGFALPKTLAIVTDQNFDLHSSSGSGIYYSKASDTCVISLQLYGGRLKEVDHYLAALLHELLHQLIEKHNAIAINKGGGHFEEALLDYFVPSGILSQKLGLTNRRELAEIGERNAMQRPYAAEASKKLLPHIEEYYRKQPKKTIWKFLKARGFENLNS